MAKNKDNEIPKGPDATKGGISADEIAALEAEKAAAGELLAPATAATPDTTKADDKKPKPAKAVPGVRITAKVASFRRAGLAFSKQPTDILLSELSKKQKEALSAEPMLSCEPIEMEVEAGAEQD